jgi:nucleotide sugar dehydrogenase
LRNCLVWVEIVWTRLTENLLGDRIVADAVIVGLGYVGLPLARQAILSGLDVVGVDASPAVVEALAEGRSHVDDVSDDALAGMAARGFRVSTDFTEVKEADAVVICVPTPLSEHGGPDLTAVRRAAEQIAPQLRSGTLVTLESTTYPGTTEEVLRPILESGSGLRAGDDFALAFSPERIDPGNKEYDVGNTPKVVGGLTRRCGDQAVEFYRRFIETVVPARSSKEAEMAKLLENTYRHVNIALVNEMARFCHELGIDLWNVIRLASTKPFGFQPFYPGPGVGGHCIPIDPNYLSHRVREQLGYAFRFVELAQEINASMPAYVVARVQEQLNDDGLAVKGRRILLLGVTYKADVGDQRESPARDLARRLQALGATVLYHDPLVEEWDVPGAEPVVGDPLGAAADADLVVLVQNHSAFDVPAIARAAKRMFDTRGVTRGDEAERL